MVIASGCSFTILNHVIWMTPCLPNICTTEHIWIKQYAAQLYIFVYILFKYWLIFPAYAFKVLIFSLWCFMKSVFSLFRNLQWNKTTVTTVLTITSYPLKRPRLIYFLFSEVQVISSFQNPIIFIRL